MSARYIKSRVRTLRRPDREGWCTDVSSRPTVDTDPATFRLIERELLTRYAADYEVICEGSAAAAVQTLERRKASGGEVALVMAVPRAGEMTGVELLREAHRLHPSARRVVLFSFTDGFIILTGSQLAGPPPAASPAQAAVSSTQPSVTPTQPRFFETGMPGVFAVGDVRHGSVKRVASSAGEGSVVIHLVHDYLAEAVP